MVTFDLTTVPERDRARVAALIPKQRVADNYINRQIDGIRDFELFDYACEQSENILLCGPTGSAKTTVFKAYAASRGLPFALVESHASMDKDTVIGQSKILGPEAVEFVDGIMTLVVRYGGVVLIDEINMAHPRIMAGFKALFSSTRMMTVPENNEEIKAGFGGLGEPQPFLIAGNMNPFGRYAGTQRLNEALTNQFSIQLEWDYDAAVESELMDSKRLLDMASTIRSLTEIRSPLSTNMLMEFERHAVDLNMDFAARALVNHFAPEERAPVARALEANLAAIAGELGVGYVVPSDDDDDSETGTL